MQLPHQNVEIGGNPLLQEWTGPYGGVPPFDKIRVNDFQPGLEELMARQLRAVDEIAHNQDPPNFENTVLALEKAVLITAPAISVYNIWKGNLSTPEFQQVEKEIAPKLAALKDKIVQNRKLFKRIESIYESKKGLTAEEYRLVWLTYTNFVRDGAKLDTVAKEKMSEINQKLASHFTTFQQHVLADETTHYLVIEIESELAGLPESVREAAWVEAKNKGLDGKWIILNTRSIIDAVLTNSRNRDLREKAWRMFISRGNNGDTNDNRSLIKEILKLRSDRAKLLGYPTHAHWRLQNSMAKSPDKAMELLEKMWTPAIARVKEEVDDMQEIANREAGPDRIEPWDYHYYMEKVRKERFDFDQNEVKSYLQLDKLREAMFFVAGELFAFSFIPVSNVQVFHPDVSVYEIYETATRIFIGLWYFDPFSRAGKRSGAWMSSYRSQNKIDGNVAPIVSNNTNFVKGKPGEPVLISWDDANTLFHEFGHALHGLCSNVTYPSLSGTAVFRDFVEFPSQLLEYWLSTPEVLSKFALHHQTGKPIPGSLIEKINQSATFKQGYATTEYLASALIDMKLHMLEDPDVDPERFEKETLAALGMPRELVMRHCTSHFLHVFASDSYSAGYYSYLWSDVLAADAYNAFLEGGGPFNRDIASRLKKYVFSVGNTIDPEQGYRMFRKKDPSIEALMAKRGFSRR